MAGCGLYTIALNCSKVSYYWYPSLVLLLVSESSVLAFFSLMLQLLLVSNPITMTFFLEPLTSSISSLGYKAIKKTNKFFINANVKICNFFFLFLNLDTNSVYNEIMLNYRQSERINHLKLLLFANIAAL